MSEFTSDSPRISTILHQLDFAPYTSGPENAHWNAPKLLHDKNMLCSSHMIKKIEVEELWLGLWLPLNYQVDIGASWHMTSELG